MSSPRAWVWITLGAALLCGALAMWLNWEAGEAARTNEARAESVEAPTEFLFIEDSALVVSVGPRGRQSINVEVDSPPKPTDSPQCKVDVFVLDARTKEPIQGAAVTSQGHPVGVTDEAGTVRFDAPAKEWQAVRAHAEGYCGRVDRVRCELGNSAVESRIELLTEAVVHGLVLEPDLAPAEGAEVRLVLTSLGLVRPVAEGMDGLASGARAITRSAGEFRFEGIGSRQGRWRGRLVVLHDGFTRFESEPFDVPNGKEVGPIVCELSQGSRIRGRVTSEARGASALVFLEGVREPVETDADGAYLIDNVAPGEAVVSAALVDHPWVRAEAGVHVDAGEEETLDFTLDHVQRVFTGVVTTPEHFPLPGVRVWCEIPEFHHLEPVRYFGRTGPDGAYRIEAPVRAGQSELEFTLRLERWMDDCSVVPSPDQVRVDFECAASATVELFAVDGVSGEPIVVYDPEWLLAGQGGQALLDYENPEVGRLVAVVVAGTGELLVGRPGYRYRRIEVSAQAGDHMDLGRLAFDPDP